MFSGKRRCGQLAKRSICGIATVLGVWHTNHILRSAYAIRSIFPFFFLSLSLLSFISHLPRRFVFRDETPLGYTYGFLFHPRESISVSFSRRRAPKFVRALFFVYWPLSLTIDFLIQPSPFVLVGHFLRPETNCLSRCIFCKFHFDKPPGYVMRLAAHFLINYKNVNLDVIKSND